MYRPTTIWVSITYAAAKTRTMMITGTGIPPRSPPPSQSNAGPRSLIGRPPVYTSVAPRAIVSIARVTMNGATRPLATARPFTTPNPAPAASPARRLNANGTPPFSAPAMIAPARASSEPTDRSIPAVRMTKVIPAAMIALMETCRATLSRFSAVRNEGESSARAATSVTNAMVRPKRWRFRRTGAGAGRAGASPTALTSGCATVRPPRRARQDLLLRRLSARELRADPPFVHHEDAVRHPQDLRHLGGDHHHRHPGAGEFDHQPVHLDLGADVDPLGRLAEQEDGRPGLQPLGDHDLLLVSPRRGRGRPGPGRARGYRGGGPPPP